MGPAALLDYDRAQAARPGARGRRAVEPCRHRRARARRRRRSALVPNIIDLVETGRRDHRRRLDRRRACAPAAGRAEPPMPKRRGCARAGRSNTRRLRDVPAVTRDGVAIALHMNAGLADRRAAFVHETGARVDRSVPHRIAVHAGAALPAHERAVPASTRPCSTPCPTGPSPSARSTSARTRSCPTWRRSTRRIRRSAGGRSASASTGRACCACSCAPC